MSSGDCEGLQEDLERLYHWCVVNKLSLNISKCSVMSFTRSKQPVVFPYTVCGNLLARVSEVRDLGVIFDSRLTFIPHVDQLVLSVSKVYGFIIRNCRYFTHTSTFLCLFNALIRSRLDYGSVAWNPIYNCHRQRIESIQKRFLKYLVWREDGVYPVRGSEYGLLLNRFGVSSLEVRRKVLAVKFLYNVVNDITDCPSLLAMVNFIVRRQNSRSQELFYLRTPRTNLLLQSPIEFMCRTFNTISAVCDINFDTLPCIIEVLLCSLECEQ
ncbi:uncharacterized protein LOC123315894 [Coccinella septempunctata]|uniref:uncharacterized protein LOC123315894 n=1 Tax=Coccinella septempunctata TaxID=41139 RepID=UPI001D074EAF|nr:uncharacterized protein LOC123315894 [Coccinella septempunctata]